MTAREEIVLSQHLMNFGNTTWKTEVVVGPGVYILNALIAVRFCWLKTLPI